MTSASHIGRSLSALVSAAVLLVLASPSPASAQCAAPTYHGGMPVRVGACPETVAGGASLAVWAVVIGAAVLWVWRALLRSRPEVEEDLALIDDVFQEGERRHGGADT
ncbi:hypothetical protein AB0L74_19130 [Streptomyces sp. NPDC052020]|uniref:hypothetical protein n=1 Tax=Streptomyces sp. NPDC052020 TaxID=3155677 RepID=UPI0034365DDA